MIFFPLGGFFKEEPLRTPLVIDYVKDFEVEKES